jgi:hypothetical protein
MDKNKRVCFSFGEPIKIEGRGAEEHRKVLAFIQDNLAKWAIEDENRE